MTTFSLAGVVALGAFLTVLTLLAALRAWRVARSSPVVPAPSAIMGPGPDTGWVEVLSRLASPGDPHHRDENETLVLQAGFEGRTAVAFFLALRVVLALAFPIAAWVVRPPLTPSEAVLTVVFPAGVGYYLPKWLVVWRRASRQRRLRKAVPNMLDLLVSCVEAGLGVDVALRHVAKDIGVASPELGEELERLNTQLSAGVSRVDALRQMERRTGVADLGALVNVLGVVERFGAGIADSLRAHAQLSRRRRALEAETRAAKAAPKLTVAMILFILPPLFVVLIGSTLLAISRILWPQISGGAG